MVVDKNKQLDKTGKTMQAEPLGESLTLEIINRYASMLLGSKEYAIIDNLDRSFLEQDPTSQDHWVVENNDNGHRPLDVCGQPLATLRPGLFRLWEASYYKLVGNARRQAAEQLEAKLVQQATTRNDAAHALSKATGLSLDLATIALKSLTQAQLQSILEQASKLSSTPTSANIG